MEDKRPIVEVVKMPHGKLYINRGKCVQIFYDSNMEPIVIKPGETKFQQIFSDMDLSFYFVDPMLWNKRREIDEMLKGRNLLRILMDASKVTRYGDMIMLSVIPKAYKEVYGDAVSISVLVPKSGVSEVWLGNGDVETLFTEKPEKGFDVTIDVNDSELKWAGRAADALQGYRNRTLTYLDALGLYLTDHVPTYVVTNDEREWFRKNWKLKKRMRVAVQVNASCPLKSYPRMDEVIRELKKKYSVVVLDEKNEDGEFVHSFRESAAIISESDVVVSLDSAFLHVAGALKKRIVAVYGNVDGKIYTEDYEKATVVQAKCPLGKNAPCWWTAPCVDGGTYQEKELAGVSKCLASLEPEEILQAVENHFSKPKKVLAVMLTYNLIEMTKKAVESIRTWHNLDLFVVDNESKDGTQEWLTKKGVEFVSKKGGVAEACNYGIRKFLAGDYDYMLLLNNDIVLRDDTIDRLVRKAVENPDFYGITIKEAENTPPWNVNFIKIDSEWLEDIVDIPSSSYSCTIFSREAVEKVGPFNPRFRPRYIEDNDYTLRLRMAGGKFGKYHGAVFYHALGAVVKTIDIEKRNADVNWQKGLALYQEIWNIKPHESQVLSKLGLEVHHRDILKELKERYGDGPYQVGVVRHMGGYGDILFSSIIGKVLKEILKDNVRVHYYIPEKYHPMLFNREFFLHDDGSSASGVAVDITDVEFRYEQQEMGRTGGLITIPRTQIYLRVLGLPEDVLNPGYVVMEGEASWAAEFKGQFKRKLIVVSPMGSNKLKEWPEMYRLMQRLEEEFDVVDLAKQSGMGIRQAAAVVSVADVVVSMDSAISNLAGAMNVPVVTVFSNRNGKIFEKMFPSMVAVQGKCPFFERNFCEFDTVCFGNGPHRWKENVDVPQCMKSLSMDKVYNHVKEIVDGSKR